MYSTGLAIRPSLMLSSSHSDSFRSASVAEANRSLQPADMDGTVRVHRSASPASTGLVGSGIGVDGSIGMKSGSRSRYALLPGRSWVRLKTSRKWSSKKKTQVYQSVTSDSASESQSGWVYEQSSA